MGKAKTRSGREVGSLAGQVEQSAPHGGSLQVTFPGTVLQGSHCPKTMHFPTSPLPSSALSEAADPFLLVQNIFGNRNHNCRDLLGHAARLSGRGGETEAIFPFPKVFLFIVVL